MQLKIKKGLDLNIAGAAPHPASPQQIKRVEPQSVAIVPDDFPGFLPKMAVKEGDSVAAGSPIMFDKLHPDVKLISPVSGTVKSVVRGDRRKLLRVEIQPAADTAPATINIAEATDFRTQLMHSGLWAMMRQRPYDIVPMPERTPRDIFVTAYDSAPLAPHLEYAVMGEEHERELVAAVKALSSLTPGKVYVALPQGSPLKPIPGAEMLEVSGPHPSGNVGVQIANVKPVNKGETVWTLDIITLCKIGQLALNGAIDPYTLITVAGPEVKNPEYLLAPAGTDVATLLSGKLEGDTHRRIISGSVLSGVNIGADGYLRYPYRHISVIREGDDADEFMGWAAPEASKPSVKRSVLGHFLKSRKFSPDARLNGGRRAMILSGEYDKVLPMDIYAEYLLKAILSHDIDKMEALGIYEVAPEDFALAEFVDTSKLELQKIVREGLDYLRKEVE
jgi:Na+-transporting NADH:ubiquinone oxidoreductase subunit A